MSGVGGVNPRDIFVRFWTSLHEATYRATNGQVLNRVLGMPVVMLTTTGRRTGEPRTAMLTAPIVDADRIVLVASNGGDGRHPAWFVNLGANPAVEVTVDGHTRRMRARVAAPAERSSLWPEVTATNAGYRLYQQHTDREIPLVILEPVEEDATGPR